MKTKKTFRKLSLYAETLRQLDREPLEQVVGGVTKFCTNICTEICTGTHACSGCAPCA